MPPTFDYLQKIQGKPFLIELCPDSLGLLLNAARLGQADAAVLLKRSPSLVAQLLAGDVQISDPLATLIEDHFCVEGLRVRHPQSAPLVELSPRGLRIVRKGRKLSKVNLSTACGLSVRYLNYLESGERGVPVQARMQRLSQALGVRFFTT